VNYLLLFLDEDLLQQIVFLINTDYPCEGMNLNNI